MNARHFMVASGIRERMAARVVVRNATSQRVSDRRRAERESDALALAASRGRLALPGGMGIKADRIKLFGSNVVGNGTYDLRAPRRPVVKRGSSCGVSNNPAGGSWGVRTSD
jgi:hypothetical protein